MHKNITLSAKESLIRRARQQAAQAHKFLNELFCEWMARYVGGRDRSEKYQILMKRLSHARHGWVFSRDEMNER